MRHDQDWHRQRARSQRRGHHGGIALMLLAGVIGGLAVERAIPLPPSATIAPSAAPAFAASAISGVQFGLCHTGGGENCVVDGDTFWMSGSKIRIADIDTPETHPSRCADEANRGTRATLRLQQLLNAGPVTLAAIDRDEDRYGRKLRIVERDGGSLGEMLVAEGLARRWTGHREPWCA